MVETIDSVLVHAARLTEEGRPHSAIAVLVPVLEEFPEHRTAWCRLAVAQLEAGAPAESLAAAKRAIVLGEPSWAHRLASLALVELGRHGEAVVSAREAVRKDPADWRGQVALAEALAHDAPAEAVRTARTAVALAPHEPRTHEVLGDSAVLRHDWTEAEAAYREAHRLDPDDDGVTAKLARLAARPADDPRRPRRPALPEPGYGRADRVELLMLVRRTGAWLAVGALVLLVAGAPGPRLDLVWGALGVLVFVGLVAWRGWIGLSGPARGVVRVLSTQEPSVAVSALLLAVAVLAVLGWILLLAWGSGSWVALVVAVTAGVLAAANSWFGLWRIWSASR